MTLDVIPWRLILSSVVLIGLGIAACQPSDHSSTDTSQNAAASTVAPATSAQAAPPPTLAVPALDYGPLGQPNSDEGTSIPAIAAARTPEQKLALFRKRELHPVEGTFDHPVGIDEMKETAQSQRFLFYAAAQALPSAIMSQDWKWVRADEDTLIDAACEDQADLPADSPDRNPALTTQVCKEVHDRENPVSPTGDGATAPTSTNGD